MSKHAHLETDQKKLRSSLKPSGTEKKKKERTPERTPSSSAKALTQLSKWSTQALVGAGEQRSAAEIKYGDRTGKQDSKKKLERQAAAADDSHRASGKSKSHSQSKSPESKARSSSSSHEKCGSTKGL
jgi:hypothetical protein